ncbi:unnamed protein product [Sphagnum jensenii]|uniref:Uncharacterized protein n=1 Tax=Sphagnum jensenii TaxID=128206 RepID=A0ABP1AQ32_9BRYO
MDPTTVLSTFLNVKAMVTDILKAREELTKMPDKTKSLLNLVDCADKSLEKLRPAASALGGSEAEAGMIQSQDQDNKNELLRPFLNSLGEELLRAHGKLEKFQRKSDDVAARNKVWETDCFPWDHQSPGGQSRAPFHDLVSKLHHLALSCLDDETCCVDVEIAPSHNSEFRPPGAEERKGPVTGGSEENRRGAREGGYEISNFTKVRFRIWVVEERFLNVIIFDNWLMTPPELFVPNTHEQQFPNHVEYRTDPLSLKLEKSSTLGTETVVMQSIYVVLSPDQLQGNSLVRIGRAVIHTSYNAKVFTLEDLKLHLDNEDIFVKHFPFDIK